MVMVIESSVQDAVQTVEGVEKILAEIPIRTRAASSACGSTSTLTGISRLMLMPAKANSFRSFREIRVFHE